jgi:hypothetical protein
MRLLRIERGGARFVECVEPIAGVDEALDLISGCFEHGVDRALVESR